MSLIYINRGLVTSMLDVTLVYNLTSFGRLEEEKRHDVRS